MTAYKDQTRFDHLYKEYLKPMLVDILSERLKYSRSWNQVAVEEDAAGVGVCITWSNPKVEDGAPFHKVVLPYSFKGVSFELGNQFMKLSRKQ